ncbi:Salicylate hydroxylase [Actinokineospora spheciospongiae]|uniref:Salicylate hydroxylase n=1 Tax=Actinokineospora spheciospongiae TaxID=909613 RepID=W7J1Y6_9PSEU|nr:FAD-dependent monooxygenase [Actinokineospora spheciospongiae]EWC62986.1 Salicylate hydroxylase [Actinokineospora spheciospongiae]PWW60443.1 bifunctional hydroxylase/dehydrase [Actinokineospora spheciospongiae]
MDAAVIVAGAGPAGLVLAAELRLAGADVIVLEKLRARTGESRGLGFTARTMEVFDQRGLLPRFGDITLSDQGHFGGLPVDFGVLDGAHQAAKTVPQSVTEAVLEQWAVELGVDLRRGHALTTVTDHGDHVEVRVDGGAGEEVLTCSWLVGCDGGRSLVRKAAGFDFPGTAATLEMFLADVRGLDLAPRMIGETFPGGMVMVGPLGDGITRLILCERGVPPRKRTAPPEFAEIAAGWERVTGEDIGHAEPVWLSSFGDATRQVTEYRRGRVLLAGDAAHIHLPAGGQGMNTSIQDAVNLGWKLGAVVTGRAPAALLDTYHDERHPVGQRLLMNTRAQGLLFLSGAEVQPLRDVLTELIAYDDVARHLAGMVSGLEIRYRLDPGSHPLLGLRVPPLELVGEHRKTTVAELLHPARGLLLDLTDNAVLRSRAAGWTDRVDVVTAEPHALAADSPLAGTSALLVRPDGHVAWAAPGSHADLPMALTRWFGPSR